MTNLIHKDLTYTIRGALFKVYNQLGPMLPEDFYQQAVAIALKAEGIKCEREKQFEVYYRECGVGRYYVDVWVEDGKVVLELKVAPEITNLHRAQAISYLKVTDADIAMVANFGAKSMEIEPLPNYVRDKKVDFNWEAQPPTEDRLYPELSDQILRAMHRVHLTLGPGFFHRVYQKAVTSEFRYQDMPCEYIKAVPIFYDGHKLGTQKVHVLLVLDKVLLATIAVNEVTEAMRGQLKARLKCLNKQLAFLGNFNSTHLEIVAVRR